MASFIRNHLVRSCQRNGFLLAQAPRLCPLLAVQAHTLVKHPVADNLLAEGVSRSDKFAVIKLGGTQYKITKDDVIVSEKIEGAEIGSHIENDQVLLLGSIDYTMVGKPLVPDAKVTMLVEEQTQDEKVIVFKKRRRKHYRRKQGHRRPVTLLRVVSIDGGGEGEQVEVAT
mmetsp:Transcript_52231/g.76381  ORF Transcript_52231/g.76381 Transcript_52231/m.76381 type:complete len:171 (+) Transcript_52231:51-563(+)